VSTVVPRASAPLVLRGRELGRDGAALRPVVMAVVNRTTDSFFAPARLPDDDAALTAAERALADGAEIRVIEQRLTEIRV
jgi:dihydropteroate synthase